MSRPRRGPANGTPPVPFPGIGHSTCAVSGKLRNLFVKAR